MKRPPQPLLIRPAELTAEASSTRPASPTPLVRLRPSIRTRKLHARSARPRYRPSVNSQRRIQTRYLEDALSDRSSLFLFTFRVRASAGKMKKAKIECGSVIYLLWRPTTIQGRLERGKGKVETEIRSIRTRRVSIGRVNGSVALRRVVRDW